jgi:hypothetical protein
MPALLQYLPSMRSLCSPVRIGLARAARPNGDRCADTVADAGHIEQRRGDAWPLSIDLSEVRSSRDLL